MNSYFFLSKEDTSAVYARNLEVVQELYHFLSAGVTGIRVSHLEHTHTHTKLTESQAQK